MEHNVNEGTARVGARQDIDGLEPKRVTLTPGPESDITLVFTPKAARRVARYLNRYANFLEPPKKRKKS